MKTPDDSFAAYKYTLLAVRPLGILIKLVMDKSQITPGPDDLAQ